MALKVAVNAKCAICYHSLPLQRFFCMTPLPTSLLTPRPESGQARRAHLVGACGTGMRALAQLLTGFQWSVTGSDNSCFGAEPFDEPTIQIAEGHAAAHLPSDVDVLVHSPAVGTDNVEVKAAQERGVPVLSYPQMLGELMRDRHGIAVCGTHGKSTTTALCTWILSQAGLSPSVAMGASLTWPRKSGWAGSGQLFVAEACEYRRAFLALEPETIVMLGVEPDHFDCFEDEDDQKHAFAEFADKLSHDGTLLANVDCRTTAAIAETYSGQVTRFSLSGPVGWHAQDVCPVEAGVMFRVCHGAHHHCDVLLPLFGRHHVMNALAAIAVAAELGVPAAEIEAALLTFPGLERRFEEIGTFGGVTVVDDYAHHPTAITATIRAARQKYPRRRVCAVFEPHQYSRTTNLFDDFAQALCKADRVIVAPIFAAREDIGVEACDQLVSQLAEAVTAQGCPADAGSSLDRILTTLDHSLEPGDVLLTMGAGNIDRIPHEFTGQFQRHSEAG